MTVRITKPEFNLREKISELEKPSGLKGTEIMRSETSQEARDLISAGRRNLIINGSMAVAQRATSVAAQSFSSPSYPVCDRWQLRSGGLDQANFDVSQQNDAPGGVCTKSIKVDVNAAESALSSGEYLWIAQTLEAQNCSDLGFGDSGASDLTISFYVKSNVTGIYSMYLYSQDPNRSISRTYTIDTSGQWERKIIHIPGDTGGSSINHDNGIGIKIYWHLLAGSDYQSSNATNWQTHNGNATAYGHEVNIATSTSNYWQLTGVQVERGSNATEFENRSFGEELALCQRYFQSNFPEGVAPQNGYYNANSGLAAGFNGAVAFATNQLRSPHIMFKPKMNHQPDVTLYSASSDDTDNRWAAYNSSWSSGSSNSIDYFGSNGFGVRYPSGGISATTGEAYLYRGMWAADAEI